MKTNTICSDSKYKQIIHPTKIQTFQQKILQFYKEQGRDLPWRHTTNRYYILVSEIMLQQTQVSRVIEKYTEWITKFPKITDLANANLSEVLTLWSGLGYNSRGKRLWDLAKLVVEKYNGTIPNSPDELRLLPGIGPYTARSVLIFADNLDLATVDTNIRRILIHEFSLDETISDKKLFTIAQNVLPKGNSRNWHNALMDYGATYLTARKSGIKPKTKQSKFKGSKRQIRGEIIKKLIAEKHISEQIIKAHYLDTKHSIQTILTEMEEEGLIKKEKKMYFLK